MEQPEPAFETPAPFPSLSGRVLAEWIDRNDHMNVSRYDRVFDEAERAFYAHCGIHDGHPARQRGLFRLEKHLRYQRELRLGAAIAVTTQIVWTDLKRIQIFHQMWNTDEGHRAATMECMAIYVNLESRRPIEIEDPDLRRRLEAMAAAHAALPLPDGVGRAVSRHRSGSRDA